jgi:hypothetical protein
MVLDFNGPGLWIDAVEARVGIDENWDGNINQWMD